uniref:tRNA (guanine-N(7)-)-methyltransferase n=1 Tax=Aureoumbra lagunensis TaxID=44058 RepID=A0A7S3NIJ4_9STRA|mmetsp:Transcript_13739/g.18326  ORF Transcript_13739/g.18326 Transcript_13739/m.18326 type:complete len:313 (-) Transcript_13739:124-1062(-)
MVVDEVASYCVDSGNYVEKEEGSMNLYPQKKYFRSRAHCNPLANNDGFDYPKNPDERGNIFVNTSSRTGKNYIDYVDVGCGFGGLSIALANIDDDDEKKKKILALEIRSKVVEFVKRRINALNLQDRIACVRTNAMIHLPHFLHKAEIEKMFFCFPDPHFKAKNFRRRIISKALLTEYAFFLKPYGFLYAITDVSQLHKWHLDTCRNHPSFHIYFHATFHHDSNYQGQSAEEQQYLQCDPFLLAIISHTEEAKKVARAQNPIYCLIAQRLPDDQLPFSPSIVVSSSSGDANKRNEVVEADVFFDQEQDNNDD